MRLLTIITTTIATGFLFTSKGEYLVLNSILGNVEKEVRSSKDLKALEEFLSKSDGIVMEVKLKDENLPKAKREELEKYLENGKHILPIVMKILLEHNLPKELAFIPIIESHYINGLRSPKGAAGIWQLMPATARNFGLVVNNKVDERLDPVKSTLAAVKYLKNLYNTFGDWKLVLAAYNVGHNKVIIKTAYHGKSFSSIKNYLPKQTQNYVVKFLATVEAAKLITQEKNLHKGDPPFEIVKVKGGYKLEKIASLIYLPKEKLVSLNPHFLKKEIPDDGREYNLYVPKGYSYLLYKISNLEKSS